MPLVAPLATMNVLDFGHYQKRLHDECTHLSGIKGLKHGLIEKGLISDAGFEKIQCHIT